MPHSVRPGDVLAGRYRLVDLLAESGGGRFWRARDSVLERHVAIHVISADDERAAALLEAARRSAMVLDQRILRVLDAEQVDDICYVVNEWGSGTSLDILVGAIGAIGPRRSAWLVSEVADSVAAAHAAGVAHGRLVPENVLIDRHGEVKIIGMCVDAAMHGLAGDRIATDVSDLAGLLYCSLTGRWGGVSSSSVPSAPVHHGEVLRPRRVRAGIPGQLDALCDEVLHAHHNSRRAIGVGSARGISDFLADYVGDPAGMADALRETVPPLPETPKIVLPAIADPAVRTDDLKPGPAPDPEPKPDPDPILIPIPQERRSRSCPPRPGCRSSATASTTSRGSRSGPPQRHRRLRSRSIPSVRCSHPTLPTAPPPAGPDLGSSSATLPLEASGPSTRIGPTPPRSLSTAGAPPAADSRP